MKIKVLLFAVARQTIGAESVEVELAEGATIGQLRKSLAAQYPPLAPLIRGLMFAVDSNYAGDEVLIPLNAEVACIPPVSGG